MSTAGPNLAGAGASVDRASATAWTTPGNITADDASTASAAVPTDYLVASSFGFSIPPGANILGVTVEVQAHETGTGSSNYVVQLHSATTPTLIGSSKNSATVTGTTPTTQSFGGASDPWGASLTPTIVNDTGFGVSLWSTDTTNTLLVDFIRITIEYSELGGEDGDTWEGGVAQRPVAGPIARAASVLAGAVALSMAMHSPVDDIVGADFGGGTPQPAAQRAQQGSVLWQWGGAVDDIVPQPAVAVFEADDWQALAPIARIAPQQPWFEQDPIPVALEEGEWTPQWAPYRAFVQQWLGEDEVVEQPIVGVPEEDGWGVPLAASPYRAFVQRWEGDDEIVVAPATLAAEEEEWRAFVVPARVVLPPQWSNDDFLAVASFGPDDQGWEAPWVVRSIWTQAWQAEEDIVPQPASDVSGTGGGTPQPASQRARHGISIVHLGGGDEIVTAATPLPFDEETWAAPWVVRTPAWAYTWSLDDEKVVAPTGIVEDDAWLVTVVDGGGSRWIPLWSVQDAIPTLPVDEHYELPGPVRSARPFVQQWADDQVIVTAAAPLPIDEQYHWQSSWQTRAPVVRLWADDDTPQLPSIVEDEPYSPRAWLRAPLVYVPWSDDELVTAVAPLQVDDEYWWTGAPRRTALAAPGALADDGSIIVTAPAGIVDEDYHWSAWWPARRPVVADWRDDGFAAPSIVADDDPAPHLAQWVVRRPAIVVEWIDGDAPPVLGVDEEPWSAPWVVPARAFSLHGWLTDSADVRYTLFGGSPADDRTYRVAGGDRILHVIDGDRRLQVEPGERDEELDT
jgi:hypothetical protein